MIPMSLSENYYRMLTAQQRLSTKFYEVYPDISSCKIDYTCCSNGPGGNFNHSDKLSVNIQQDSSLVAVVCINSECTKGYFDLSEIIKDMSMNRQQFKEDILSCEGWDDNDKLYDCRCKLKYSIQIEYAS